MGMPTAKSSGLLTTNQLLWTGHHTLNSIQVVADGTNVANVIVYDNTSAAGKILAQIAVPAGQTHAFVSFDRALYAEIGLFVSVSGTGSGVIVGFGAS